jgi:hypothetical protein
MLSIAATMLAEPPAPVPTLATSLRPSSGPPFEVVFVTPPGFRGFEQRLIAVLRPFGSLLRLTRGDVSDLARFTRERVFLSASLPNVILIRAGEVLAATIGELPTNELALLVSRTLRCAR